MVYLKLKEKEGKIINKGFSIESSARNS